MGWWARFRGRELPERTIAPTEEGGALRDGKKHGVWIDKGQEGWVTGWMESIYRDGVRHGPFRYWHVTGFVLERGTFVDGAKEGEGQFFDKEGRRFAITHWRAGKWHGAYTHFKDDGTIDYEREYRDGNVYSGPYDLKSVHGDWYSWRKTYKDGHPIGVWEENDFKGRPKLRRTYDDDGVLDGAWSDHHEDGAVKLAGAYAKGARAGVWEWKAKDGALIARCDYGGDGVWAMPDGTKLDARDDEDLARWIALADAMRSQRVQTAIDAWPEDDRERAVAWVEAKVGAHKYTVGIGAWLGALIDRDGDPRCRLIGGISTDHGIFRAAHVPRMVAHAHAMRVLSFYEEDFEGGVAALFPPDVAWPKLEKLSIYECGGLGAIVRTLAAA
ncbi:MAG TPA: hypothetical protein VL463_35960, partial [Kofleriaceae bacterium]|nr:hypothetical protein [Kofleriaceae bacterium]